MEKTVMSGNCTQGVLSAELDYNAKMTPNELKNIARPLMVKNKELMDFFKKYF